MCSVCSYYLSLKVKYNKNLNISHIISSAYLFHSCAMLTLMLFLNSQDIVSEHPERFFVAEIVREKIFMQYRNEIPYACQVVIEFIFLFMIYIATFPLTLQKETKEK